MTQWRSEIMNLTLVLDEVKKYKEILKFPLLSANTYVNGRLSKLLQLLIKTRMLEMNLWLLG